MTLLDTTSITETVVDDTNDVQSKNGYPIYDSYTEAKQTDQRFFLPAISYATQALNQDWDKAVVLIARSPNTVSIQYRGHRIGQNNGKTWSRWAQVENYVFRLRDGKLNVFYMHRKSTNIKNNLIGYKKLVNVSQKTTRIFSKIMPDAVQMFISELEALYTRNGLSINDVSSNVSNIFRLLKTTNSGFGAPNNTFASCVATLIHPIFDVPEFTQDFVSEHYTSNQKWGEPVNENTVIINDYSNLIPKVLDPQLLYKKSIDELYLAVTYKGEKALLKLLRDNKFDLCILNYLSLSKTLVSQEERFIHARREIRKNKAKAASSSTQKKTHTQRMRSFRVITENPANLKQLRYLITHVSKSSNVRSQVAQEVANRMLNDTANSHYISENAYLAIRELYESGGKPFRDYFSLKILKSDDRVKGTLEIQEELVNLKTKKAHRNWVAPKGFLESAEYTEVKSFAWNSEPFESNNDSDSRIAIIPTPEPYILKIADKHNIYYTKTNDNRRRIRNSEESYMMHINAYHFLIFCLAKDIKKKLDRIQVEFNDKNLYLLFLFCKNKNLSRSPSWLPQLFAMSEQKDKLFQIYSQVHHSKYGAELFELAAIAPLEVVLSAYPNKKLHSLMIDDF